MAKSCCQVWFLEELCFFFWRWYISKNSFFFFPVWFTNMQPYDYVLQTESIFQECSRNHFLQACAVLCNCVIWVSIWHELYYIFTTTKCSIVPPKSLARWGHQKIPQKYFFGENSWRKVLSGEERRLFSQVNYSRIYIYCTDTLRAVLYL